MIPKPKLPSVPGVNVPDMPKGPEMSKGPEMPAMPRIPSVTDVLAAAAMSRMPGMAESQDLGAKIQELNALHESGAISDQEFAERMQKIAEEAQGAS
jgi:hypothetical protein